MQLNSDLNMNACNLIHFSNTILSKKLAKRTNLLTMSLDYQIFNNSEAQITFFLSNKLELSLPQELKAASLKRQAEFLAGRMCAMNAMLQHGVVFIDQPGRNLDRSPKWQKGIIGTISHSNNIAVAVVGNRGQYSGVGVDIEKIPSNEIAKSLLYLIEDIRENKIHQDSSLSPAEIFAIIFSGKEALFKALYPVVQTKFYFHDVGCIDINITQNSWTMLLTKTLSSKHFSGRMYRGWFYIGYGYIASFVVIE